MLESLIKQEQEISEPTDQILIHNLDAKHNRFQNEFEKQLNRLPDSLR